jgi:uncharacterized protein (TIGR03083 family)
VADFGGVYEETRLRVSTLLDTTGRDARVPCCPAWRVRDVVAHVTGVAQAWVERDLDGYASPDWTDAQVRARAAVPLSEVLEEWAQHAARLVPILRCPTDHDAPSFMPGITVGDLVTHEHDIRGAIGDPGARDSEACHISFSGNLRRLTRKLEKAGAPGLNLVTESDRFAVGPPEGAASLNAPRFEVWRSLSGRRSRDQVGEWSWEGDRDAVLAHWLEWPFEWPRDPIVE